MTALGHIQEAEALQGHEPLHAAQHRVAGRAIQKCQHAFEQSLRFVEAPLGAVELGDFQQIRHERRMVRPEQLLGDGQRPLQQRHGFLMAILQSVQVTEPLQGQGNTGMLAAIGALVDGNGTLAQAFGVGMAAQRGVDAGHRLELAGDVGMIRPEQLFHHGQHPLRQCGRLLLAVGLLVEAAQLQQREHVGELRGRLHAAAACRRLVQVQRLLEGLLGRIAAALAGLDLGQSVQQLCALRRLARCLLRQCQGTTNGAFGLAPVLQGHLHLGQISQGVGQCRMIATQLVLARGQHALEQGDGQLRTAVEAVHAGKCVEHSKHALVRRAKGPLTDDENLLVDGLGTSVVLLKKMICGQLLERIGVVGAGFPVSRLGKPH